MQTNARFCFSGADLMGSQRTKQILFIFFYFYLFFIFFKNANFFFISTFDHMKPQDNLEEKKNYNYSIGVLPIHRKATAVINKHKLQTKKAWQIQLQKWLSMGFANSLLKNTFFLFRLMFTFSKHLKSLDIKRFNKITFILI